MSGDLAAGSCPTYAVVDKRKKKAVAEMNQESSTGFALYAVVDKAKKKKVLSPAIHDDNEYSNVVGKSTELQATSKEEAQPTYSVLERDETSEVVMSKTSSLFNHFGDKDKKWKAAGSTSQLWLYLVIVIFAIAFLTLAFGISAGVSYSMISRLRAEISLNEELVNSLRYELEVLQKISYNNSVQLSAKTKDTISINMSIFNAFPVISALKNGTFNLFELVNQLNMSTIFTCGLLKDRIKIIENATFGRSRLGPAPSCQAIHIFQPSSTSGYYWVSSSNGSSVRVYCDMTKSCGTLTGGLTRVALLNNETRSQL